MSRALSVEFSLAREARVRLVLRDVQGRTVAVLGLAFKGDTDDTRSSLAYLLADLLAARAREVLCTDPLVSGDPDLLPLETVLDEADLLVIGAPHPHYQDLRTDKPVVDIWNLLRRGVLA